MDELARWRRRAPGSPDPIVSLGTRGAGARHRTTGGPACRPTGEGLTPRRPGATSPARRAKGRLILVDFVKRASHHPLVKVLAGVAVVSMALRRYTEFVPW